MSQRDKKETIAYYEEGTERQKRLARRWQKMLKEEFYDKKNRIGRQGLYLVLKLRENSVQDKYPTKRFVGAWLKRQNTNQINRKPPRVAPSIQAVIVRKPNELIQVDYMYFYRDVTGAPIADDDEDIENSKAKSKAQLKEIEDMEHTDVKDKYKKGQKYSGVITAIDCFTRYGYAIPIRKLNSKNA